MKIFILLSLLSINTAKAQTVQPTTGGPYTTTDGTYNYDMYGNRTGPYYLDTVTTGAASTISPLGGSATATGVPMGATPTTATGVPMGATPMTGAGATIGATPMAEYCQMNQTADVCRNNQPPAGTVSPATNR